MTIITRRPVIDDETVSVCFTPECLDCPNANEITIDDDVADSMDPRPVSGCYCSIFNMDILFAEDESVIETDDCYDPGL